jgi:uncharacterized protein
LHSERSTWRYHSNNLSLLDNISKNIKVLALFLISITVITSLLATKRLEISGELDFSLAAQSEYVDTSHRIDSLFEVVSSIYVEVVPSDTSFATVYQRMKDFDKSLRESLPGSRMINILDIYRLKMAGFVPKNVPVYDVLEFLSEIPYIGSLVSVDRKSFLVPVTTKNQGTIKEIETISSLLSGSHEIDKTRITAAQSVTSAIAWSVARDLKLISIGIIIIFLALIYLSFQSFRAIFYFIFLVILSIMAHFVVLSAFLDQLDLFTVLSIPIVIVVTVANSVHLLSGFVSHLEDRMAKVKLILQHYFTPGLLSATTTSLAFFSLCFSEIESIRNLGIVSGISILYSWLIVYVCGPYFLYLLNPRGRLFGKFKVVPVFFTHNKRTIAFALLPVLIVSVFLIPKVTFKNDIRTFIPKKLKQLDDYYAISKRFDIDQKFDLLVESIDGRTIDVSVDSIEKKIRQSEIINEVLSANSRLFIEVGLFGKREVLSSNGWKRIFISKDPNVIRLQIGASYNVDIMQVKQQMDSLFSQWPSIRYSITCPALIYDDISRRTARSLIRSLLLSLILIMVGFIILSRKILVLTGVFLANLVPLACLVVVLVTFSIDLNILTSIISVVCIGLIVDDTIHLVYRQVYLKHGLLDLGFSITLTTTILVTGFSFFAWSNFTPTQVFGLLCALVFAVTLISDLTILPYFLGLQNTIKDETEKE